MPTIICHDEITAKQGDVGCGVDVTLDGERFWLTDSAAEVLMLALSEAVLANVRKVRASMVSLSG